MKSMLIKNYSRIFHDKKAYSQSWVAFFLAASLLATPISSTAKSIFILVSVGLIIVSPVYWRDLSTVLTRSWSIASLCLFFIVCVGFFWSPASLHEKLISLEKYSKLLSLPILVVGFQDEKTRRLGLHGFLLAMVVTCIASAAISLGYYSSVNTESGGVFRNHIITGYMMAFAAYLSSLLFLKHQGKARIAYGLLTLLFSYHVLFVNNGRTGYVIYLLLMGLLIVQSFSWRQAVFAAFLSCFLLAITFYESPVMQDAFSRAITEYKLYSKNEKDTSIGFRFQFHDYAHKLFQRHPFIGNGTASFGYLYHQENPIPSRGPYLLEPHSQYWLMASELGAWGCIALALFFGCLFYSCLRLKTYRSLAMAVLLPFLVGNLSDSLLFYSATGYFFIIFIALCLGEQKIQASEV